jgi:hypothetical protein
VPELEAWEKVLIAKANGSPSAFMTSLHGPDYAGDEIEHALTCQMCHNGPADNSFADMAEAHAGVVRDPSVPGNNGCLQCHDDASFGTSTCAKCHEEIVTANANSLHTNLWGEKAAIELRAPCTFEGSGIEDMFTNKCGGCHTTCGQCHISRPNSVGGGFPKYGGEVYAGHRFKRSPDNSENCTACHGSRIGVDFAGDLEGNVGDVHSTDNFMKCEDCHTSEEIHGDNQHEGDHYTNRYQVKTMPRCNDAACHPTLENNTYHSVHVDQPGRNLQCQVCHSQPYKNCTNCHNLVADEKADKFDIDPSVVQFKIGKNPIKGLRDYDFCVVRHVPVDPGTYADWGLELNDYLVSPTWKYASPHNILRVTPQTTVAAGKACSSACHQTEDSPEGFFLRESDLYDANNDRLPDYEANIDFVIRPEFPSLKESQ